jgi:cupin fold WbuC family metalloprotein
MIKITDDLINSAAEKAGTSARKRINYNFHQSDAAIIQRMLNAVQPGTYIQPHKHEDPDKTEIFIILKGRAVVVEFDDRGKVADHVVLDPAGGAKGVEIPPGIWHTFITLKPDSVLYEVKEGPYDKDADKRFAPWSPAEGASGAAEFNHKVLAGLKIAED